MVEPIMYLAIGFLLSMLVGLTILPLVHNRAVRLTTRRLEAATPISLAEIQADKDQLRAEFAMSARRLEMSVEQLRNKTTSQLAELGKKSDAINRMKLELSEKTAAIFSLEAREKTARDQLKATEDEFTAKTQSLRDAEAALAEKQKHLAMQPSEGRDAELALLRAEIEALRSHVSVAGAEFAVSQQRLQAQRDETRGAAQETDDARQGIGAVNARVGDLDQELRSQTQEVIALSERVAELQTRLQDQTTLLQQSDAENAELREHVTTLSARTPAALDDELARLRNERDTLKRELAGFQQQTETSWATERMENALLRERINDIAAEVAKLAITLEGPNSAIEAILAADTATPSAIAAATPDNESTAAPVQSEARGTLADRIRALQAHASRMRPAV